MDTPFPAATLQDAIALGARRMLGAAVCIGHDADNAIDEARSLVMHALHLPEDLPAHFAEATLLPEERARIETLFERRIKERIPAAYLIGSVRFGDLRLKADARALVPRSPLLELIPAGYAGLPRPDRIERVLELCTGGGCLALAMAAAHPDWHVDAVDLSAEALELAAENRAMLGLEGRVELLHSDLYAAVAGRRYELIVANPPYLSQAEYEALPAEYAHEPELALPSGVDGLDLTLRILREAPRHLQQGGLLVVEIGEAERALRRLLPQLPLLWVDFRVGGMGVFAITREALVGHLDAIATALTGRQGCTSNKA
jgi:ribosomal protein L3 glutamine methyltransferase